MKRFEVEYDFVETKWGRRALYMRGFDTREEAEQFASEHHDANIVEYTSAWRMSKTGKSIRLW